MRMTSDAPSGAVLTAATIATGLVAGLLFAFSVAVMPALGRTADRTFVDVMQQVNAAIQNPAFFLAFLGAPLLIAVAAVLQWRSPALPWLLAGLALYGVMIVVTAVVNVPLNNVLADAGPAAGIDDPAGVRAAFEARWVRWNLVRTLTSAAALGCLVWAVRS